MVTTLFLLGFGVLAAVLAIWRTGLERRPSLAPGSSFPSGWPGISPNLISLGLLPGEALDGSTRWLMVALLCSLVALMLFRPHGGGAPT